jgi:hypothetical protein
LDALPRTEVPLDHHQDAATRNDEDLAAMLDELWQFVDEEGRARSDIDVAFGTPAGGRLDEHFNADAHMAALDELATLGVTWVGMSVPGASLAQSLEGLERYGASVIAPSRA